MAVVSWLPYMPRSSFIPETNAEFTFAWSLFAARLRTTETEMSQNDATHRYFRK